MIICRCFHKPGSTIQSLSKSSMAAVCVIRADACFTHCAILAVSLLTLTCSSSAFLSLRCCCLSSVTILLFSSPHSPASPMPRTSAAAMPARLFLPLPVGVLCSVFLGEKPKQHACRGGDGESSSLPLFLSLSVGRPRPGLNSFSRSSSSSLPWAAGGGTVTTGGGEEFSFSRASLVASSGRRSCAAGAGGAGGGGIGVSGRRGSVGWGGAVALRPSVLASGGGGGAVGRDLSLRKRDSRLEGSAESSAARWAVLSLAICSSATRSAASARIASTADSFPPPPEYAMAGCRSPAARRRSAPTGSEE